MTTERSVVETSMSECGERNEEGTCLHNAQGWAEFEELIMRERQNHSNQLHSFCKYFPQQHFFFLSFH